MTSTGPRTSPVSVFEQDTVRSTTGTVDGPRGPVQGATLVEELLMDGTVEHKAFAPGYGEFRAQAKDELVTGTLAKLAKAAAAHDPARTGQAALGAEQAALDLRLRHRAPAEVDLTRLDLWARRLLADAAAKDRGAVAGDVATLQVLWNRAGHAAVPALRDALGRVGA